MAVPRLPGAVIEPRIETEIAGDEVSEEPSVRGRLFTRDFWHGFSSCFISMIAHAAIVVLLAIYVIESPERTVDTLVVAPMDIERPDEDLLKTELDQIIEAAVEKLEARFNG
mgnify:CR=1 FL=1